MTALTDRAAAAVVELWRAGVCLTIVPGLYRVNFRDGGDATAYETADLETAIAHGRRMAQLRRAKPAAPFGRNRRRKQRLAARRMPQDRKDA